MDYRFRIVVTGKVQGVFFRKITYEKALKLGLTGWVTNNSDGSVTFECQGIMEQCFQLIAWAQFGPPLSSPENIQMIQIDLVEGETKFEINN